MAVTVDDCEGNPISGLQVRTFVTVDQTSGGHLANHPLVVPRPLGGLREDLSGAAGAGSDSVILGSDDEGRILLQFVPPEVSGNHTISAECMDIECYALSPPLEIKVRVPGLISIPPANVFYTLTEYLPGTAVGMNIGDAAGTHNGVNHHLTPSATENLWRLAFNYAALMHFQPIPEKLHINDASLPDGGLFDIKGQWKTPHKSHRKGTVVDIRANEAPGAIPNSPNAAFKLAAEYAGAYADFEDFPSHPGNNHYHVLLMGVAE